MKEIKAFIQPHRLSSVIDALKQMAELPGATVSEVMGFGRKRAKNAPNKVTEDFIDYALKAKLEIVVPDKFADQVIQTILEHAHTGRAGDGLIFVSTVDDVFRIRTKAKETYS